MHDHAETAGCEIVPDMVESVEPVEDGDGWDEHVDEWFDDEILPADHNLDEAAIEAARADLKGGSSVGVSTGRNANGATERANDSYSNISTTTSSVSIQKPSNNDYDN